MRIAIVTPAFNVAPYIGDAIVSVLAQTHRDWTMAVVDDGSTDATAAVAARFAYPGMRLLRQANAGVSAARNRGSRPLELSHTRVSCRTNGLSVAQRKYCREIRLCVMFWPGNV